MVFLPFSILTSLATGSDLLWRPMVGNELNYHVAMQMSVEKEDVQYTTSLSLKVSQVDPNGAYQVVSTTHGTQIKVGRQVTSTADSPARTESFDANGHRLGDAGAASLDPLDRVLGTICEFSPPGKVVNSGDTWGVDIAPAPQIGQVGARSEYMLRGKEGRHGANWRVDYRYRELSAEDPPVAQGYFLLSTSDNAVFQFEATIEHVQIDPNSDPGTIHITMKRA